MRLLENVDDQKSWSTSAAASRTFKLTGLSTNYKGLPLHLYALILKVTCTIRQASPAVQFNPEDFYKLLTLVEIVRGTKSFFRLEGHQIRAFNAYGNGWRPRELKLPDPILAYSGGGNNDTAYTFYVPIFFDTPGRKDRRMFVSPTGAFGKGSKLIVNTGVPTTEWDSSISITGDITVDVLARLVAEERVLSPVPFEAYNLDSPTTSSYQFPMKAGLFDLIALTPPRFGNGGGDAAATKYSAIDAANTFAERLRSRSGAEYQAAALCDVEEDTAETMVEDGFIIPVVGPDYVGDGERHILMHDKEWFLNTTVGSALSSKQSLLCVEIKDVCQADEHNAFRAHGFDPLRASRVTAAKCLPPQASSKPLHPHVWRPGSHPDGSMPDESPGARDPHAAIPGQC